MTQYDLGILTSTVESFDDYTVTSFDSTDVFSFVLSGSRNINLYLHNIGIGGDADLSLYRDSNGNGILDASDQSLAGSSASGNSDDTVSYAGTSGTYFAEVEFFSSSSGIVSYDLDLSSSYDFGTVFTAPETINNYTVTASDSTDVFEFQLTSGRNINLNLHDITSGDDADLNLYRDVNNNGIFDATDQQSGSLRSSTVGSNNDDSINYRASAGTYFAEVGRYASGSNGSVRYDLDVSATSYSSPSNLLPKEVQVGNLSRDINRSGRVNNTDTSDVYAFSLGSFEGVNIRLTNLSNDADIRVIRDSNNNRIVDAGEVVGSSTAGGSSSELISGIDQSGSYYLQVYQYGGNASYTARFDHYTTSFA